MIEQLITRAATRVEQVLIEKLLQRGFVVFGTWQLVDDWAIPVQAVRF